MPKTDEEKSPLELTPPNPLLKPVVIVFTIIIALIFGAIVGIGGWNLNPNNDVPRETVPPVEENREIAPPSTSVEDPVNNSCATVSEDEVQSCCAQWAINNDMMLPQCVGNWSISEGGTCSWQCAGSPTL